ncbi:hypothetical protein DFO73_11385 [Cytobacillus oceanisediminis]|jgi:hypothetical protein|uniref:Uncharacterized protein n=1 Tax=Cytobacillus oceanisediminis TaxID=665099 RepID=A0A2V2ZN35_9BACI|nr:hypothetical protein DFO73_11385 [Cytobacillus oceanisediminis]
MRICQSEGKKVLISAAVPAINLQIKTSPAGYCNFTVSF